MNTQEQILTFNFPLTRSLNSVSINLSGYPLKSNVDASLNLLNTNKQNIFTCFTPLIKNNISNNISIDLSAYPLKSNVDTSLNTINNTLSNKQNIFLCITPLIKNDISNNISIHLSAYAHKNNVDSSLNSLNTNKTKYIFMYYTINKKRIFQII